MKMAWWNLAMLQAGVTMVVYAVLTILAQKG